MQQNSAALAVSRGLARLRQALAGAAVLLAVGTGGLAGAHKLWSVRVPTPFVEADQPVTLELVDRKPPGEGPLRNDHLIVRSPSLWAEAVSGYLDRLGGRP